MVKSAPPLASSPSGPNARHRTLAVCPSRLPISSPLAALQSRTILSNPPVATVLPSPDTATAYTAPECWKVCRGLCVSRSHKMAVLSDLETHRPRHTFQH